jgi:GNAT superfamily N-acetyltransferase
MRIRMGKIWVRKVETRQDLNRFIRLPWKIYRSYPHWVPPLIAEQKYVLNRKKGPFFEIGEAEYFLAFAGEEPVGRISAHVNHQWNRHYKDQKGFFGFFECIEEEEVAAALFAAAEEWLRAKGKTSILGPMSFSIYDELGLLIDCFDQDPVVLLAYNPPYYVDLVEKMGFRKAIDWYAYLMTDKVPVNPVLYEVRDRVLKRNGLVIRHANLRRFKEEAEKAKAIFNEAWSENWGHLPFTDKQFDHLAKGLRMILDERLVLFGELKGKPVGLCVSIPDANQAVKGINGRLFPFGWYHVLRELKRIKKLRTIIMGVKKEHRHTGIDVAFYVETIERGKALGYTESECSLVVETNTWMRKALDDIGASIYKTYRLYEKPL